MNNLRAKPLELTRDVSGTFDPTKTYVTGRAALKTLTPAQGGKTVVGTPLNGFADTISDAAVTPARECVSDNGHELQFVASTAAGVMGMVLYDVDETTGVKTYVGRLNIQLPAGTHTQRAARLVNDSGATGWRILVGTVNATTAALGGLFSVENIAKADFTASPATIPVASAPGQKAVYWHQETGGTNNLTVMQGAGFEFDCTPGGTKILAINGLVATPVGFNFDMGNVISTVGGSGVTTDWYISKTGTITGWAGVFLLLNNFSMCIPSASSGAPVALQGSLCLFIPTSSNMGLAKVSEFTSGVVTIPSYTTRDALDVANTNTALTPATMHFSQTLQRIVFQQSAGMWVIKQFVNAAYELVFGTSSDPQYRTAQPIPFIEWGGVSITSTYEHAGWLYMVHATAGQIGCSSFDLRSLHLFDHSSIISKVIDVPNATFVGLSVLTPVRSFGKFFYKVGPDFSNPLVGWLAIPEDRVMTGIPNTTGKISLKFQPRMERSSVTIPLQIIEAHLIVQNIGDNDSSWNGDARYSVATSPARTAWSQVEDYTGSKHWEAYIFSRDTGALVYQGNTQDNPLDFELSTNDGTSFSPIAGSIASNKLNNVLRLKWASPPGVPVRCSLREKV